MNFLVKFLKRFSVSPSELVEYLLVFVGVLSTVLYFAHFLKIFGNSSSRLLVALGPIIGIGKPYENLWEFVPPGFLALVTVWMKVFGWQIISLKFLQAVLLFVSGIVFIKVLRKLIGRLSITLPLLISFIFIFYSPSLQTDMLSIELFATTFALSGLLAILNRERTLQRYFLAAFLFSLSSQIKETMTFTIFVLVPFLITDLLYSKTTPAKFKILISVVLGLLLTFLISVIYLLITGSWEAYMEIVKYKAGRVVFFGGLVSLLYKINFVENFYSENFLHFHNYLRNLSFVILALYVFKLLKKIQFKKYNNLSYGLKVSFNKFILPNVYEVASLIYGVAVFTGLILYNQYSADARLMPIAAAFLIMNGMLIKFILRIFSSKTNSSPNLLFDTILFLILLVSYSPQNNIIKAFPQQIISHVNAEILNNDKYRANYIYTSDAEVNDYIFENTINNDCILNPYGWEVAETYIYSKRRPCSKYFLVNILYSNPTYFNGYLKDIINNPPKVMVINTQLTDLNIEYFSQNIFNYPKVAENCYTRDSKYVDYPYLVAGASTHVTLYWQKSSMTQVELKGCLERYGIPSDSLYYK